MIVKEIYGVHPNGENLVKTYSDKNEYIKKVGTNEVYTEAIDLESKGYTYEETGEKIPEEIPEELPENESISSDR